MAGNAGTVEIIVASEDCSILWLRWSIELRQKQLSNRVGIKSNRIGASATESNRIDLGSNRSGKNQIEDRKMAMHFYSAEERERNNARCRQGILKQTACHSSPDSCCYLQTCPRLTLRAPAATEKNGGTHTHTHTH